MVLENNVVEVSDLVTSKIHRRNHIQRFSFAVPLHYALLLENVGDGQCIGVLIGRFLEIDGHDFASNDVWRIPAEHKRQHLAKCFAVARALYLCRSRPCLAL